MRKIFIYAMMLFALASCKGQTKEDVIKDTFKEYVKTDFDDPNDFIEVTKVEVVDTLNAKDAKAIIVSLTGIQNVLTPQEIIKLADYAEKFENDTTNIISYRVKARIKRGENKAVVNYYVIDNGKEMKVQDHELGKYEVPELYINFFKFAEKVVDSRLY